MSGIINEKYTPVNTEPVLFFQAKNWGFLSVRDKLRIKRLSAQGLIWWAL